MFGTTASQPNQSFSGFGTNTMTSSTTFGQPQAQGAFGVQQQAAVGTTIKFAPIQGTDTMMKSGVQQNISTRHQVSFFVLISYRLNFFVLTTFKHFLSLTSTWKIHRFFRSAPSGNFFFDLK
jgi:hypothetical protein